MKKFSLLIFFALFFCISAIAQETQPTPKTGDGIGSGAGNSVKPHGSVDTRPLRLLAKPRANYTDVARENGIEGFVTLRVTFLASGQVGAISPVSALPYGLTEQAIAAARGIRFEPAAKDGQTISVTKLVQYSFTIYFDENDAAVAVKPEILEMPEPQHPQAENFQNGGGKVQLRILLNSDGTISILNTQTDLPKEFAQKAAEAVAKIKFKPAVDKNGKKISVTKIIEYEFKTQN